MNDIPTAGAVDLAAVGKNGHLQREMRRQGLVQHGLLCHCGARFEAEGIAVFSVFEGTIPTQEGPREGAVVLVSHFHSRSCPDYLEAVKNGLRWQGSEEAGLARARLVAIRELPAVQWIEEPLSAD